MSVLIKGMEMPEKCGSCDLFHVESPMHCTVVKGHKTVGAPYGMTRPDWCPLIEIPEPHGDLIDRDAFRADFSMGENCDKCGIELKRCEYDRNYTKMDFCGWLDDAPVIIEAEGSESHDD